MYFIFILIPVQTLFAHNWLTLPQYTSRAFEGFVGENFEFFVNLNPILIFILTPIVTAFTLKKDTYKMMIWGTLVMAAPTFFLTLGPNFNTLMAYLILMTVGEAMWQPRFLQWVAEIAPERYDGHLYGYWAVSLVPDQSDHCDLLRLVPAKLLSGRYPFQRTQYRNHVVLLCFDRHHQPDRIGPGQKMDGERV
jgi:MFS family permease